MEEIKRTLRSLDALDEEVTMVEQWIYANRTGESDKRKDGGRIWKHWSAWVDKQLPNRVLGRYLQAVEGQTERKEIAAQYITHCARDLGEVDEQLSRRLRIMRAQFKNHAREDLANCWSSDLMESVQQAAKRTLGQTRQVVKAKRERQKWDVNMRIMYELAQDLGAFDDRWDQHGMTQKGIYLGAALMLEVGVRPSNQSSENPGVNKEDHGHAWRYEDVKFVVRRQGTNQMENWQGGKKITKELIEGSVKKSEVIFIGVAVPTDKMTRKRGRNGPKVKEPSYIGRRSEVEEWLLEFLLEWIIRNGERAGEELLFRRRAFDVGPKDSGMMAMIRKHQIVRQLKKTVERLGLGVKHFAASSFRKAFITEGRNRMVARMQEEATKTMIDRGQNWVRGSKVPQQHYIQEYAVLGPFGLTDTWKNASQETLDKYHVRAEGRYDEDEPEVERAAIGGTSEE